jgi:hypothetical protein
LEEKKRPVTVLTMYDDIGLYALLRRLRDRFRPPTGPTPHNADYHTNPAVSLFDPDIGVRDKKNPASKIIFSFARSAAMRRLVLFIDLLIMRATRFHIETIKKNILIVDRYFYDSLADIAYLRRGKNPRGFNRFFLSLAPQPDAPVFVDATPEQAFARKREYPLDYLEWRRGVYLNIFEDVKKPIIVVNRDLTSAIQELKATVAARGLS